MYKGAKHVYMHHRTSELKQAVFVGAKKAKMKDFCLFFALLDGVEEHNNDDGGGSGGDVLL